MKKKAQYSDKHGRIVTDGEVVEVPKGPGIVSLSGATEDAVDEVVEDVAGDVVEDESKAEKKSKKKSDQE